MPPDQRVEALCEWAKQQPTAADQAKPVWQLCTQLGLKPIYADSSPFLILENNGNLASLYRLVEDWRVKSVYAYPPSMRFVPEPPKPPPSPPDVLVTWQKYHVACSTNEG